MRIQLGDSQQALGFLIQQTTFIEAEVYKIQYPEIIYQQLIPIDTSANEWSKSVTYFSMDKLAKADWFDGQATDMRFADINRTKFEQGIEMAGIGYRYTLEEIGQAMMIPGLNLTAERAESARFAYEQFMDRLAYFGSVSKNFSGLFNNPNVTIVSAIADGTGSSALWTAKTADQMIRDINITGLTGVYEGSNTVEIADTVLLPIDALSQLANTRVPNTFGNALDYIAKYNLYTYLTGAPLTIRGVLGLGTAGVGGVGRMVCYRKNDRCLKLHVPMVHRFLPVWQTGPITFDIPGIFRTGSVEVRIPGSMRYVDGITPASPATP
jgi:hypothetical protein